MPDVTLVKFLADTGERLSLAGTLRIGDVRAAGFVWLALSRTIRR